MLRRELNYLPRLFVPSDFLLLNHHYGWWEDVILLLLYIVTLGLLIYSWRYLWALLKEVAPLLYISVAVLALLQYMGENAIGFPHELGVAVEELSEGTIYSIALVYLWHFKLSFFEASLSSEQGIEFETCNH